MRLFVAIEIPQDIRQALASRAAELRGELPRARWVRAEAMHLTLAFLGETDPARRPALERELAAAFASIEAFEMGLAGVGAFPPRGRARVLWVGIEAAGDLEGLERAVRAAVRRSVGPTGDEARGRRFHPHVTLARSAPTWPRSEVERLAAAFGDAHRRRFAVDHGVLVESELRPEGARYRTLASFPLKSRMKSRSPS